MTEIVFYLHDQYDTSAQLDLACRLLQKISQQKLETYVYTSDQDSTDLLDAVLWVFLPQSFIPHCLYPQTKGQPAAPVRIGHASPPADAANLLLNMTTVIPPNYERFNKICELIPANESFVKLGRKRYTTYQAQGHTLQHHHINGFIGHRLGSSDWLASARFNA